MRRVPDAERGFSLLEVLVALVVVALFAVAGYRALDAVIEAESRARGELAHWQGLTRAWARMAGDLGAAVATGTSPDGRAAQFFAARRESGEAGFALGRLAGGEAAGGVLHVRYRYAAGRLHRDVREAGSLEGGSSVVLVEGLARAGFRYMDAAGAWRADWPGVPGELPRAVEVVLAWPEGAALRRVFLVR